MRITMRILSFTVLLLLLHLHPPKIQHPPLEGQAGS